MSTAISSDLILKSLFAVLSADDSVKLFERKSILRAARELGLTKDEIRKHYSEWSGTGDAGNGEQGPASAVTFIPALLAFLVYDAPLNGGSLKELSGITAPSGLSFGKIEGILNESDSYAVNEPHTKRAARIKADLGLQTSPSPRKNNEPVKRKQTDPFYIAYHISYEGLDELQRLIIAKNLDCHVAIDGPPGTGKTQSVIKAAALLGMNLYTKTCSSRTVESHIISYPVLTVQDGASVTGHVNGPLLMAMENAGIFYGDEFNLLKEDVQKRLNSAFDDRRYIDRNDGEQIAAGPGFWAVISYNPSESLVSRDLEDSVADRFIHFHYGRWNPDFKAYVAACRSKGIEPLMSGDEKRFGLTLGWRGIRSDGSFMQGEESGGKIRWREFFTGQPSDSAPEVIYRAFDQSSVLNGLDEKKRMGLDNLARQAFSDDELARMISRFTELLHSLAETGKSPLLEKIGMKSLLENEDFELLAVHRSSARIEIAALKHYQYLVSKGFNRYLAQAYAVRLVIDQVCYGQYRDKKLKNDSVHKVVTQIARGMRLLADNQSYNTRIVADSLLKG
jgi:hypothetical protein